MPAKFQLIKNFLGYVTKPDETNTSEKVLVNGSQNVLISDEEKVVTRNGYELLGASNSSLNPIESTFDWNASSGGAINLRSFDDELEIYTTALDAWVRLEDGFSNVDFEFTTWWSSTEGIDLLLFVNGSSSILEWSGGITTFASSTSNTLTKEGSTTWGAERFLTAGTRQVDIIDTSGVEVTFTYTGGEGTTTLTGVTPDPTSSTFAVGANVFQTVRTNTNTPSSGATNDVIGTLKNQVYVAANDEREISVSSNTDFTSYSFSSPRTTGEGALLTLDNKIINFKPLKQEMIIFAGNDDIYRTSFTLVDSTGIKELLRVEQVKTGAQQGAFNRDMIEQVSNAIVYLTNEQTLRIIEDAGDLKQLITRSLSNPIKPDFDAEDFTNGHIKFHRNRVHIAAPASDKVYILEFKENANGDITRFWQPPQILPIRRFAIIGGNIHGHSNSVPETYRLFRIGVYADNANSFKAKAVFSYRNFGDRVNLKSFDEYYSEGFISSNTDLKLTLRYDFEGSSQELEQTISGVDDDILFGSTSDASLGVSSLGTVSLAGDIEESAGETPLDKFRVIGEFARSDFHELQVIYETDDIDRRWQLLSHGPAVTLAKSMPVSIKR